MSRGLRSKPNQSIKPPVQLIPQLGPAKGLIEPEDPAQLETLPVTRQKIVDYIAQYKNYQPFVLRAETFRRIERITGTPLICYVSRTANVPSGVTNYIDDSDLTAFGDMVHLVEGEKIDVLLVSNGGSAETTERIVHLLRERFEQIRFIIPANAYSAATMMCLAGDEILMGPLATLGPIDPQIGGIPARAILRSFERLEQRLKEEGPQAITAYMPLLQKYDLHTLEICRSAEELSQELARTWLSKYMYKCQDDNEVVTSIVKFFASYDVHKSHSRGINRQLAREIGLKVNNIEEIEGLADLVSSLRNQYDILFDQFPFYKVFEDARGTNWGRQFETIRLAKQKQ